jgi:UDP-hydrolysing UDP-N-acetyl-D-glucosamine 2-epimerase
MTSFADVLERLRPNAVIILGDRYELLAFATAALMSRVAVVHIAGGELTEGALDDSVRNAITKMSSLHFPSTETYRNRIIQMGESPHSVFCVGALGIDAINELSPLARSELSRHVGLDLSGDYVLVTYHPVTLAPSAPNAGLDAMIGALGERPDLRVIVTGVNADPGNNAIDARIREFAAQNPERVHFADSLGQRIYLSAMKYCAAVIGNSSSGIVEAPALGVPTVNVGMRQRGRVRAQSVIDSEETGEAVRLSLAKALSHKFREFARTVPNPYGDGTASRRIVQVLKNEPLLQTGPKPFWDIDVDFPALCA